MVFVNMNKSEPFIPRWAESALTKPSPFDVAELKMLREFYQAWLHYHTIPKDGKHKDQQRKAGDALIVLHEALEESHAHCQ
jgi:hypothetical protein